MVDFLVFPISYIRLLKKSGIYPSSFNVRYTAQKTKPYNWVFQLQLNSNGLLIKQTQKQTNKYTYICLFICFCVCLINKPLEFNCSNLFLQPRERNIPGQKSVKKLQSKVLLLFNFSEWLSLSALFWNWKNILTQNCCFPCKCSLLQTCFPCFVGVYLPASVILQR